MAQLLGPGDAFRKPLLPSLYEPVLTNLGNGVLVLRGIRARGGGGYGSGVEVRAGQQELSRTAGETRAAAFRAHVMGLDRSGVPGKKSPRARTLPALRRHRRI